MTEVHPAARDLLLLAVDNGWGAALTHGIDSGGSPFVTVSAKRDWISVDVCWHTRDTGTYRLFSCLVGRRHVSLRVARAALEAAVE